ncbi:MAG: ROK family protein, partial [Candidatus Omnitrophota bacterium]
MSYYIGIDLGATRTKFGLLNDEFKLLRYAEFNTPEFPGKKLLIQALEKQILHLREKIKFKPKAIGIGVPGLVNPEKGLVYYLVNIPGWENVYLKRRLENSLGVPVFIDNDVNVMALAELYFGRAKGKKNVLCITLGTGVG